MSKNEKERAFQNHIFEYLKKNHQYESFNQKSEITDREYYIAEDTLFSFLEETQKEKLLEFQNIYGGVSRDEIVKALKDELKRKPLWLILRLGLEVRNFEFKLFYPKPRSFINEDALKLYQENRFSVCKELVIKKDERIDLVIFLNGLPVITIELKHEDAKQDVEDAVEQYVSRDYKDKIFQLPFLHIAADTADIKVATNIESKDNFLWFNEGLINKEETVGEYPIEYLYKKVLSFEWISSYLSFYLLYNEVEKKSIFPRYHQIRSVNKIYEDIFCNFLDNKKVGEKYLIDHSAGSGKTLTISWVADRIHSIYNPITNKKAIDIIFIVTDRKDLDKNVSEDLELFTHLKDSIGFTVQMKSQTLKSFIDDRKPIIVTTINKFNYILDELKENESLKDRNIAFLIDEAHRSQDGKMGISVRTPFKNSEEIGNDEEFIDSEEDLARKIVSISSDNMVFIAFTATPSKNTVTLFGKPFDTYTEAEAIKEEYILDVATNIISYETLFNMRSSVAIKDDKETLYPKGTISKALKQIAFADEGVIQYKSEIMLRIFEKEIADLIEGKAKVMVVASSRPAGLLYYKILKEKILKRECKNPCKVLYAFSDFKHPETKEIITEATVNGLKKGELIEDRFKKDDYKILVVANKFQTGFNEPLLSGMFLDKVVIDRNAVQTLSRLNRCYEGKKKTIVVDFTNNSEKIFRAFKKYREGTPYEPAKPNKDEILLLVKRVKAYNLFSDEEMQEFIKLYLEDKDAEFMSKVNIFRGHFKITIKELEEKKIYINLLSKFVKQFYFLSAFFEFDKETSELALFCEIIGPLLLKQGKESELLKELKNVVLTKAHVKYLGIKSLKGKKRKTTRNGGGTAPEQPKVSLTDMIKELQEKFNISEKEAIVIREICEEKLEDREIVETIYKHREDESYLREGFSDELRKGIVLSYDKRGMDELTLDGRYDDKGGILDSMTGMVINHELLHIGKMDY